MAASIMKRSSYPMGPALEFLQRLWALNHALEMLSNNMATRLGVTAQQRLVIRCLGKYPGLPAGQLASLLHLDPGTISAALRRLESKKLIARKRDPEDHRRAFLRLTKKGQTLDRGMPGTVENAVEHLLAHIKSSDVRAAIHVLERLTARLHKELRNS
jgi:DNA-binding MarR family transcriptional regulator